MRIVLVVNTTAASVTTRTRRRAAGALAEVCEVRVAETLGRGHATALAEQAVSEGADAVVVLGGDGTLNEVAGALVGTDCLLGALPGGSTSVFARTLGLPRDTVRAAESIGTALESGSARRVGLGRVDSDGADPYSVGRRWFTLHAGIGWDAALVQMVERRPSAKRWFGQLPFVISALRTFGGGYDRTAPHFSVELPSGEVIEDGYFALVLNSDPYTFVGPRPFTVAPSADMDSGLSVVVLTSLELRGFLSCVSEALAGGGLHEREHVRVLTDLDSVGFRRRTTMPHQLDGDYVGDVERLVCTHHPDALGLLVPGRLP